MTFAQPTAAPIGDPAVRIAAMNSVLAHNWWAVALRGVAGILFGLAALLVPHLTLLSLVFLFAIYMAVDGVFDLVAAARAARQHSRWGLLILQAVVSFIAAAAALFLPRLTILAFVILVAAWALVTGAFGVAAAFRVHQDHGRVWLFIGSIASIILGVLLVISPLIGALVLAWWLGAFALVFGVSMLVLAFRLRARHRVHPEGALPAGA